MNESTLQRAFIEMSCFPHQAEFAASFFAPGAARKQLLLSAPGMGKGFVAAAIVNHAITSGMAHRILVLAPAALVAQWQEVILRGDPATPVMIVDRRRFREIEASFPVGQEIWPENAVVLMSLDFAWQADIAASLVRSSWDLLVVDEVQLASPQTRRAKLLLDLMSSRPQMRVLLLRVGVHWNSEVTDKDADLFRDAVVTVWTRETVRDHQGNPLLPEVRMEWIAFRRSPEELAVLSTLQDTVRSLDMTNAKLRFAAATLLQSASSSPFALEQRLRRIDQRRNELVHGAVLDRSFDSDAEELGMGGSEAGRAGDELSSLVELLRATSPLLDLLEELPTDSKCDALVALLESLRTIESSARRVCVITRFVDTAKYLASTLRERADGIWLLTGGSSNVEREQTVREFARGDGVLIATEVVAIPIPEVVAVVFYDLPLNPNVLEKRIGQFVRVGRRGPIRLFAFNDESNALVIERLQRKITDLKQVLSEQEIEEEIFTKDGSRDLKDA